MQVRALVGGAVGEDNHEAGDILDVDEAQAEEWIAAGIASADLAPPSETLAAPESPPEAPEEPAAEEAALLDDMEAGAPENGSDETEEE